MWPLMLDDWRGVSHEQIRVVLPAGYEVVSRPRDLNLVCAQGHYSRTVREESRTALVVDSHLEVGALRVEPAEYQAFRAFINNVHRAQKELLTLRATGTAVDSVQAEVSGR